MDAFGLYYFYSATLLSVVLILFILAPCIRAFTLAWMFPLLALGMMLHPHGKRRLGEQPRKPRKFLEFLLLQTVVFFIGWVLTVDLGAPDPPFFSILTPWAMILIIGVMFVYAVAVKQKKPWIILSGYTSFLIHGDFLK